MGGSMGTPVGGGGRGWGGWAVQRLLRVLVSRVLGRVLRGGLPATSEVGWGGVGGGMGVEGPLALDVGYLAARAGWRGGTAAVVEASVQAVRIRMPWATEGGAWIEVDGLVVVVEVGGVASSPISEEEDGEAEEEEGRKGAEEAKAEGPGRGGRPSSRVAALVERFVLQLGVTVRDAVVVVVAGGGSAFRRPTTGLVVRAGTVRWAGDAEGCGGGGDVGVGRDGVLRKVVGLDGAQVLLQRLVPAAALGGRGARYHFDGLPGSVWAPEGPLKLVAAVSGVPGAPRPPPGAEGGRGACGVTCRLGVPWRSGLAQKPVAVDVDVRSVHARLAPGTLYALLEVLDNIGASLGKCKAQAGVATGLEARLQAMGGVQELSEAPLSPGTYQLDRSCTGGSDAGFRTRSIFASARKSGSQSLSASCRSGILGALTADKEVAELLRSSAAELEGSSDADAGALEGTAWDNDEDIVDSNVAASGGLGDDGVGVASVSFAFRAEHLSCVLLYDAVGAPPPPRHSQLPRNPTPRVDAGGSGGGGAEDVGASFEDYVDYIEGVHALWKFDFDNVPWVPVDSNCMFLAAHKLVGNADEVSLHTVEAWECLEPSPLWPGGKVGKLEDALDGAHVAALAGLPERSRDAVRNVERGTLWWASMVRDSKASERGVGETSLVKRRVMSFGDYMDASRVAKDVTVKFSGLSHGGPMEVSLRSVLIEPECSTLTRMGAFLARPGRELAREPSRRVSKPRIDGIIMPTLTFHAESMWALLRFPTVSADGSWDAADAGGPPEAFAHPHSRDALCMEIQARPGGEPLAEVLDIGLRMAAQAAEVHLVGGGDPLRARTVVGVRHDGPGPTLSVIEQVDVNPSGEDPSPLFETLWVLHEKWQGGQEEVIDVLAQRLDAMASLRIDVEADKAALVASPDDFALLGHLLDVASECLPDSKRDRGDSPVRQGGTAKRTGTLRAAVEAFDLSILRPAASPKDVSFDAYTALPGILYRVRGLTFFQADGFTSTLPVAPLSLCEGGVGAVTDDATAVEGAVDFWAASHADCTVVRTLEEGGAQVALLNHRVLGVHTSRKLRTCSVSSVALGGRRGKAATGVTVRGLTVYSRDGTIDFVGEVADFFAEAKNRVPEHAPRRAPAPSVEAKVDGARGGARLDESAVGNSATCGKVSFGVTAVDVCLDYAPEGEPEHLVAIMDRFHMTFVRDTQPQLSSEPLQIYRTSVHADGATFHVVDSRLLVFPVRLEGQVPEGSVTSRWVLAAHGYAQVMTLDTISLSLVDENSKRVLDMDLGAMDVEVHGDVLRALANVIGHYMDSRHVDAAEFQRVMALRRGRISQEIRDRGAHSPSTSPVRRPKTAPAPHTPPRNKAGVRVSKARPGDHDASAPRGILATGRSQSMTSSPRCDEGSKSADIPEQAAQWYGASGRRGASLVAIIDDHAVLKGPLKATPARAGKCVLGTPYVALVVSDLGLNVRLLGGSLWESLLPMATAAAGRMAGRQKVARSGTRHEARLLEVRVRRVRVEFSGFDLPGGDAAQLNAWNAEVSAGDVEVLDIYPHGFKGEARAAEASALLHHFGHSAAPVTKVALGYLPSPTRPRESDGTALRVSVRAEREDLLSASSLFLHYRVSAEVFPLQLDLDQHFITLLQDFTAQLSRGGGADTGAGEASQGQSFEVRESFERAAAAKTGSGCRERLPPGGFEAEGGDDSKSCKSADVVDGDDNNDTENDNDNDDDDGNDAEFQPGTRELSLEEALVPLFASVRLEATQVRVNYTPRMVDLASLQRGQLAELLNLIPFGGVELDLGPATAGGPRRGFAAAASGVAAELLTHVAKTQVHKLFAGVQPLRSLGNVGHGVAELVALPLRRFRKDRSLLRGLRLGWTAFLSAVRSEAINVGLGVTAGVAAVLDHAAGDGDPGAAHAAPGVRADAGAGEARSPVRVRLAQAAHAVGTAHGALSELRTHLDAQRDGPDARAVRSPPPPPLR